MGGRVKAHALKSKKKKLNKLYPGGTPHSQAECKHQLRRLAREEGMANDDSSTPPVHEGDGAAEERGSPS